MKKSVRIIDGVVLACAAAALAFVAFRIHSRMHYEWNWAVIGQFLLRYDPEAGRWVPNLLLRGFFNTVRLSLWATLLAALFGLTFGLCRVSRSPFKRLLGGSYVESVRNLPPIVLVFIFYFFVSEQIFPALGLDELVHRLPAFGQAAVALLFAPAAHFSAFAAAVLALAIYEGAYITEIIRAGIQSVDAGQWEAAHALGLTWSQQMRHVILPQAMGRILPPLAGQFISTIKDSAILSVISVPELTFQGLELMASTHRTFEIWITITALYFLLTFSCSTALRTVETRLRTRSG